MNPITKYVIENEVTGERKLWLGTYEQFYLWLGTEQFQGVSGWKMIESFVDLDYPDALLRSCKTVFELEYAKLILASRELEKLRLRESLEQGAELRRLEEIVDSARAARERLANMS